MHILLINFTADHTPDQFDDEIREGAPMFAQVEGLL